MEQIQGFWKMVPENAILWLLFLSIWQIEHEIFWKCPIDRIVAVPKELRSGRPVHCEPVTSECE